MKCNRKDCLSTATMPKPINDKQFVSKQRTLCIVSSKENREVKKNWTYSKPTCTNTCYTKANKQWYITVNRSPFEGVERWCKPMFEVSIRNQSAQIHRQLKLSRHDHGKNRNDFQRRAGECSLKILATDRPPLWLYRAVNSSPPDLESLPYHDILKQLICSQSFIPCPH